MIQSGKKTNGDDHTGIELLLRKYRKMFRIPENLDFYSEEDFKQAEKKFIKYALQGKIK